MEYWWNEDFTDRDIAWIMEKENNQTSLVKRDLGRALGGKWLIRDGNVITLAELFLFGMRVLSCYDLYRLYVGLPILIHKRHHSVSNAEDATKRRNAKMLRYQES